MAANIVVADVVVTLDTRDIETMGIRKRVSFPSIAFGHASLQLYPNTGITIGVPMPAIGAFGMKKAITRMFIQGDPARGYYYVYDPVNNTIRIYQSAGFTPAGTITNGTPDTFAGAAVAAGPPVEVPNGTVVLVTVLQLMVIGA
jgi:hypothetical protein